MLEARPPTAPDVIGCRPLHRHEGLVHGTIAGNMHHELLAPRGARFAQRDDVGKHFFTELYTGRCYWDRRRIPD